MLIMLILYIILFAVLSPAIYFLFIRAPYRYIYKRFRNKKSDRKSYQDSLEYYYSIALSYYDVWRKKETAFYENLVSPHNDMSEQAFLYYLDSQKWVIIHDIMGKQFYNDYIKYKSRTSSSDFPRQEKENR